MSSRHWRFARWCAAGLPMALAWAAFSAGATPVNPARTQPPGQLRAIPGQPVPAPVPASAVSRPEELPTYQRELLRRLESGTAEEQAAARSELAAIASFWNQPEMLKRMAQVISDEQLKADFEQRTRELEFEELARRAGELPPVSLTLKDSTLEQMVEALNKALDRPGGFVAGPVRVALANAQPYTLEVKDKPLWEVFGQLQSRQPFDIGVSGTGLRVTPTALGIHRYAVAGPAMLFPISLTYRRSTNPQAGDEVSKSFNLNLGLAIDPRLEVLRYGSVGVLRAVDDAGQNLLPEPLAAGAPNVATNQRMRTFSISLAAPDRLGKSLTVTCEVNLLLEVGKFLGMLRDLQANINRTVMVGNRAVRVTRLEVRNRTVSLQIVAPPGDGEPPGRVTYSLLDGAGKTLWTGTANAGIAPTVEASTAPVGPFTLEIQATRSRVVPLRFEIADIPIP